MLNLSDSEFGRMSRTFPQLLCLDTASEGKSSIRNKIKKLKDVVLPDELHEIVIKKPMVLSVPVQSVKIRYMIANTQGDEQNFFMKSLLTNEKKAWARVNYLHHINAPKYWTYVNEKQFVKQFGVTSEELMKVYPLDKEAVEGIEKAFYEKTGEKMTLDSEEIKELGFERE